MDTGIPASDLGTANWFDVPDPVYIADILKIVPPLVPAVELAEAFFAKDRVGERLHRLSARLARGLGIENRPCVLDLERIPDIALIDEEHAPLSWGCRIVDYFLHEIDSDDIGFLGVSYNISSHSDVLPNLACQIAMARGLDLEAPPHELAYYGCAPGLLSIRAAIDACRRLNKAAIVFCFDQCTWRVVLDACEDDPDLRKIIRTNLLFSDGGIGLLLVPQRLRGNFPKPLPQLGPVKTGFEAGNVLRMTNGAFLVGSETPKVMPPLVMEKLIRPAIGEIAMHPRDIADWSIHQGGPAILDEFCKDLHLGLLPEQIAPARSLFARYGNLSSPSSLFVLDHYFHDVADTDRDGQLGAILGFGAGYYLAFALYRWSA